MDVEMKIFTSENGTGVKYKVSGWREKNLFLRLEGEKQGEDEVTHLDVLQLVVASTEGHIRVTTNSKIAADKIIKDRKKGDCLEGDRHITCVYSPDKEPAKKPLVVKIRRANAKS